MSLNVESVRNDFAALRPRENGRSVSYLDSACMSLVPESVLAAMEEYYRDFPGCAGRSLHRFSEEVGRRFEASRAAHAKFLGRADARGVVFVRNATEALNLVGQGFPWKKGDRVLISDREHNSNLVVWQRLVAERGIRIEFVEVPDDGPFDPEAIEPALARGVRLVSLFHTSNLDGRTLPAREIAERAHDRGARVLFDGCQAAPHEPVDLDRWGIDYYALSCHKMLGPTGTGLLASTPEALADIRPLLLGGETVERTTLETFELRPPPHRFEAGLQNYAGAIGSHAGIDYLTRAGLEAVRDHQEALNRRVTRALEDEPRLRVLGPTDVTMRPSIFAFCLRGIDPHDVAIFLDEGHSVMVRSGMNCVHSWYDRHGLSGNVRASFYLYNNTADADALVDGIRELLARVPASSTTGTSEAKAASRPRRASGPPRSAGSTAAAARSARPRGRAGRGRAGSARGSG
jgi:cysteine desulfurase / selenocysteine lyase